MFIIIKDFQLEAQVKVYHSLGWWCWRNWHFLGEICLFFPFLHYLCMNMWFNDSKLLILQQNVLICLKREEMIWWGCWSVYVYMCGVSKRVKEWAATRRKCLLPAHTLVSKSQPALKLLITLKTNYWAKLSLLNNKTHLAL